MNNKCWRRCVKRGTLLHCWWEFKLVQPLWQMVWRFLKIKIELPCVCVCVCVCVCARVRTHARALSCFSNVQLFEILWTIPCQDPLPMGFSRQEYWSGSALPTPGDLPNPGIKLAFPALPLTYIKKAREFQKNIYFCFIDYAKAFDCVDHNKLGNSERDGNTRPPDLPLEKPICRSGSNS